jgi:fructosamine-3-kinase
MSSSTRVRRRLIAPIGCLLLVAGLCGCGGNMRADELGRSVGSLGSAASEGSLLAQGVVQDRTKTTFVRVRARELGETVQHEAEKLGDASAQGAVAVAKNRAVELAGSISQELGDLQTAPDDVAQARRAQRTLTRLADQASRLAAEQA